MQFYHPRALLMIWLCRLALAFLLAALVVPQASAQRATGRGLVARRASQKYYSVSVGTGTAFYFGDLANTGSSIINPGEQINMGVRIRFSENFSMRFEGQYYTLSGSDALQGNASRAKRNLSFRSNNFEVSALGQFDLVKPSRYQDRYSRRAIFNSYLFGGIGFTSNNPQAELNGRWVNLRPLGTEGVFYAGLQPVVPVGLGVRFRLGMASDLMVEYGYRIAFTDYLDDVSGNYKPRSSFSNELAAQLSDRRGEINPIFRDEAVANKYNRFRGNPAKNDAYGILSVKYQYTFTQTGFSGFRSRMGIRRSRGFRFNRYK